ncbi:unnamed protein product [Urochloa decumbens]|uniref:C2H2-type domain-containing protein n=1 Tax=Urochloa decumbens TaxID=240449 RepID=A0ABC8WC21_9POAL
MDGASGNEVFECEYCQRKFRSRRSRGGHLKAHSHLRASRQAAASAQNPPRQQQPNTSQQQLSVAVSLLALPAPDTNSELVTVPLETAQDSTPVVLFRCCCGAIEKIPRFKDELMERGTYEGGCYTLDCRHQHRPSEEIQPLTLLPPPAENAAKATSLDADEESEENIDLTLRI